MKAGCFGAIVSGGHWCWCKPSFYSWSDPSPADHPLNLMMMMIMKMMMMMMMTIIQLLESPCPSVRRKQNLPHHRYMHQSQGSWIYASFISASYTQESRIIYICIVDTCIMQIFIGIKDHRYICASYIHASGSRIEDHRHMQHTYVHHTHMHHDR